MYVYLERSQGGVKNIWKDIHVGRQIHREMTEAWSF